MEKTEKPKSKAPDSEAGHVRFDLRWEKPPPELRTIYSNQMLITHAGGQFYLVFGEIPPILEGDLEEAHKARRLPKELLVKPVARIAMTPEVMARIAEAIRINVEKFRKNYAEDQEPKD